MFTEGSVITAKKPHACGGNKWTILRVGADIKLKCLTCGRIVFLSLDQTRKIVKKIEESCK